ncbi:MAG: diacylglycerol kinase family protein [Microbacteriaceae bacterium]
MATTDRNSRPRLAAVVYNPIKVDLPRFRTMVASAADSAGWPEPLWFATAVDEAGQTATRQAIDAGATLVLAVGGDGTVRAVAEALRGTRVALGLIPAGTGNLLARNLEMTVNRLEEAIETAFTGIDHPIDVGVSEVTRPDGAQEEHAFLVMAGLGLDAKMIANTSSKLKKAVGWLAYIEGGMRALPDVKPVKLRYRLDGRAEKTMTAHTLIIGNCGVLPGGILLIPDARPDNGRLEVCALKPRGFFGWLNVWNKIAWENGVLRKSRAGRRIIDLRNDVKSVTYFETRDMTVAVPTAEEFQLDGDECGQVTEMRIWVDAGSLTVKMPA